MRKRPNILWLCTDQQRFDTIHALGNDYIDTPYMDRLCREGVAFTSTYCQNPVCTPSRASFLSGKYPSQINVDIMGADNLPEHCTLITKALSDVGYHCGNIGKLHLSAAFNGVEKRGEDGYAEFAYSLSPGHNFGDGTNEYKHWLDTKGVDWTKIFHNDKARSHFYWFTEDAPLELRQTAWCAERAIEFIKRNNEKPDTPWLLTVNCFDPHPPYDAPKDMVDKYLARNIPDAIFNSSDYDQFEELKGIYHQTKKIVTPEQSRRNRASYYAMCEIVDTHFGRIIDTLDELGIRDDTVIIWSSDHGELIGDHGLEQKGCRFYEGSVRVPLIFSCPARFVSNKQVSCITELTDIAPTLADIAGIPFPDTIGYSLLPVLSEMDTQPTRDFVRCEYYDSQDDSFNPNEVSKDRVHSFATMYRDDRYKIVVYHGFKTGELYDLKNDPREEHNLWHDQTYAQLRFELLNKSFEVSVTHTRAGQHRVAKF